MRRWAKPLEIWNWTEASPVCGLRDALRVCWVRWNGQHSKNCVSLSSFRKTKLKKSINVSYLNNRKSSSVSRDSYACKHSTYPYIFCIWIFWPYITPSEGVNLRTWLLSLTLLLQQCRRQFKFWQVFLSHPVLTDTLLKTTQFDQFSLTSHFFLIYRIQPIIIYHCFAFSQHLV